MVQVDIKTSANTINFPKNQSLTGDLVLTLHSELTQRTFTFNVTDEGNSKRFYKFTLDLSNVDNGEYDYNINNIETGLIRIGAIELSTPEVVSFSDEVEIIQYGDDRSSQFQLQSKDVEYEENGEYEVAPDAGYYGLKKVNISVNVPDSGGYESGYTDGYADGYASGTTDGYQEGYESGSTDGFNTGYESGNTDGYNSGYTEGYDRGNTEGYDEGVNAQKARLVTTAVTSNGTYTREDGYSSISVNVPSGSTINNQNKNVSITANTAMTVTFDTGYTGLGNVGIDVNVPQTGHTDEELEEKYQSGYTAGFGEGKTEGYSSGLTVGYNSGLTVGYNNGYTSGYDSGLTVGYNNGWSDGYSSGYTDGFVSGQSIINYYTLTVQISSNDTSGLIGNATVTVATSVSSEVKTYNGKNLTFEVLPGLAYTVTFGNVQSYIAPNSQTGNSTWGGSQTVSGYYNYSPVIPYREQYFTIELINNITGGGITLYSKSSAVTKQVEYRINNGVWTSALFAKENYTSIPVSYGDKVEFRGDNSSYEGCDIRFYGNSLGRYTVYGNIMSLINSTGFTTATTLADSAFVSFFAQNYYLEDVSNLILENTSQSCYKQMFNDCRYLLSAPALPATTLANYCYQGMFSECWSLTSAPELPATTLSNVCYQSMFKNCRNLNYIKCLATDISALGSTGYWVQGVAASGTFVKQSGITWTTGDSGIPSGWTVVDAE